MSDEAAEAQRRARYRALVVFLVAAALAWALVDHQTTDTVSDTRKSICEAHYGAGLCVKSNGEWVRIGS